MESRYTIRPSVLPKQCFSLVPQMQVFSLRSFAALTYAEMRVQASRLPACTRTHVHHWLFTEEKKKKKKLLQPSPPVFKALWLLWKSGWISVKMASFAYWRNMIYLAGVEMDWQNPWRRGKISLSQLLQYRFYELTTGLNQWVSKFQPRAGPINSQACTQTFYSEGYVIGKYYSCFNFQDHLDMIVQNTLIHC